MSRISIAFFGSAALYALASMVLAVVIRTSNDFTLVPVSSYMSVLGWASLAAMGAFYGIAGDDTPVRLAWSNLMVSNIGNLIALPSLAMVIAGDKTAAHVLALAHVVTGVGMAIFGLAVLQVSRRLPATP